MSIGKTVKTVRKGKTFITGHFQTGIKLGSGTVACVDELMCLQGGPLTEGFPTQLTHEVLYT